MRRRHFLSLLGGAAAAWPVAASAQQPTMPVIGFLDALSSDGFSHRLRAFRRGLASAGYSEGENVTIEYRSAEGQIARLPELASQLVRRKVSVLVATGTPQAFAAKAATTTIPIIFTGGGDPARLGLVSNFARPEGNITGVSFLALEVEAKRLELLRELVPNAAHIAVLVNPTDVMVANSTLRHVEAAARTMGVNIQVLNASTSREIDAAFESFGRTRPDALFAGGNFLFASRRTQLANLAAHYSVAMATGTREITEAGGLLSYGSDISDAYRQIGAYTGRILKGAKPTDLPVVQASKFELVINVQTARILRLTVPPKLIALADEVIE